MLLARIKPDLTSNEFITNFELQNILHKIIPDSFRGCFYLTIFKSVEKMTYVLIAKSNLNIITLKHIFVLIFSAKIFIILKNRYWRGSFSSAPPF